MIELADVDATPDVAKLLADRVGLRSDTVTRALCAPADERGRAPVPRRRVEDERLLGDRADAPPPPPRRGRLARRGAGAYQQIPLETAQRVIRFLKVRETAEAVA